MWEQRSKELEEELRHIREHMDDMKKKQEVLVIILVLVLVLPAGIIYPVLLSRQTGTCEIYDLT